MIDRSPTQAKSLPGMLLLRTAGACDLSPEHLLEVFGEQRRRCRMPGGGLFIRMAHAAEDLLGKAAGHQLHAHRHPLAVEATGQ